MLESAQAVCSETQNTINIRYCRVLYGCVIYHAVVVFYIEEDNADYNAIKKPLLVSPSSSSTTG